MPKFFLIGGNRSTVGAIKRLRAEGFEVAVAEKLPRQDAFPFADRAFEVAPHDVDGLRAAIREWGNVDGIGGINEPAMISAALLQEELRLPGLRPEIVRRTVSKIAQRQAWANDANLNVPFQLVASESELQDAIASVGGYPVILKPELGVGSRGVSLAANESEAKEAFAFAQAHSAVGSPVLVETALQGPQFSAELMTLDGVTKVLAIGRKLKSAPPYRVDLAISYPGLTDRAAIAAVERMAAGATAALGITRGPGHIEFAIGPNGPRPIELAARCGGSITGDLAAHVSGYHPMVEAAKLACGLASDGWPTVQRRGAVLMFLAYRPGRAKAVHVPVSVRDDAAVVDAYAYLPESGEIEPLRWASHRVGYLGVVGEDGPKALDRAIALAENVRVESYDGDFIPPLTVEAFLHESRS